MPKQLRIDNEFRDLIPPLSEDEYSQLENNILSSNECRDALITWRDILIDGHNRYQICHNHGIEFNTKEMQLDSREAVIMWIIDNQLGRRNLTDFNRIELAEKE